jgi:hypothetical protein
MMMKRKKSILLFIISGVILLCLAAVGISAVSNRSLNRESPATDRLSELDKARLAEAIHLRRSLGNLVWPGFGQAEIPVIIWNQNYSFLVGPASAPPGWETTDDLFQGQTFYRQPSDNPQNFAVEIEGEYAASMATKSETDSFLQQVFRDFLPPVIEDIFPYRLLIQPSEVQISAVAHESFHVFQQIVASKRLAVAEAAHRQGEAYWQVDEKMGDDWKTEIDLLLQAVQAQDDGQAKDLARRFLAQRQERRVKTKLAPELVDYERQLEWEEGLAKYIELAIWRAAYEHTDYAPILTGDADFKGYRAFPGRLKQELNQLKRQAGQEGETRFYYTGLAEALLLDRLDPDWKAGALAGGVWLEDLLNSASR